MSDESSSFEGLFLYLCANNFSHRILVNATMNDRLIQALFNAIGGLILGVAVALQWSYFIDMQTSSVLIIFVTVILAALLGFCFPKTNANIFRAFWHLFK